MNSAPLRRNKRPVPKNRFFYELLRKGGTSAHAAAFHIVLDGNFDRVPIEPMMLVKARVLRRNYSVLEIGRDLTERNELVAFVIRRAVNPGLQAALHMYSGGGRIDPPGSHEDQRGKRLNQQHTEADPSNNG